jgi:hypothetical protein
MKFETHIWNYISEIVNESAYLPSVEEVEDHFEMEAAPYEIYEYIPKVRQDYIKLHLLDGVMIA